MVLHRVNYLVLLSALAGMVWATTAEAVPSFARQTGKSCSYCHNAWPQLNEYGRSYKELGYRLPDEEPMTFKEMVKNSAFPVSAVLKARPYDKKDSGDAKFRVLHEVEVIIAGSVGNKWSTFVELEAEDETDFNVEVAPAVLSFNYNEAVNLQFIWGPFMWADPYGFIGDHFRLTRGHVGVIDQKYGGADGKLRDSRQTLVLSGRPIEKLFYSVGYAGESKDAEGVEAGNYDGRIAFDVTDDIMLGGFAIIGDASSSDREYTRYGLDFQADFPIGNGNARLQGAYVSATDDNEELTGEEDNKAWSLQAYYTFEAEGGKPTWVPLVRYDSYEKENGSEKFEELTLNLSRYIGQNVRAYLEYWDRLDSPPGDEDNRVTLQLELGF